MLRPCPSEDTLSYTPTCMIVQWGFALNTSQGSIVFAAYCC